MNARRAALPDVPRNPPSRRTQPSQEFAGQGLRPFTGGRFVRCLRHSRPGGRRRWAALPSRQITWTTSARLPSISTLIFAMSNGPLFPVFLPPVPMAGRVALAVVEVVRRSKLSAGTRPQSDARAEKPSVRAATTLARRPDHCPVRPSLYSGRVMLACTRSPLPASFCARTHTW